MHKNSDDRNKNSNTGSVKSDIDFNAPKIKLTFWDSIAWPFSSMGRLKHYLALACKHQQDKKKFDKLKNTAKGIEFRAIRSDRPEHSSLLVEVLIFIFNKQILESDLDDAFEILSRIENYNKEAAILPHLRIGLLKAFFSVDRSNKKILSVVLSLVSDKKAHKFFQYPILLTAIDYAYTSEGTISCLKLLENACEEFKKLSTTNAILILCNCPAYFENIKDAKNWGEKINPDKFIFSTKMSYDANLIQTKVAEWRGDTEAMTTSAKKALELDNANPEANYWLIRSHLHNPSKLPSSLNIERYPSNNDQWNRICLAVELHNNKDFNSVKPVIKVIKGDFGKPDIQEQILLLDLIKRVLKPSLTRNKNDIIICAELSENIRLIIPGLGWATVNIALNLIINVYRYDIAFEEIHKPECFSEELAQPLQQIIGFLSDKIQSTKNLHPSIATLQKAKEYFVLTGQKTPLSITNLQHSLNAQTNDAWIVSIPGLTLSIRAFIALLSIVEGNKKGLGELTQLAEDNNLSPDWLRWLVLRFLLLDTNINDQLAKKLFIPNQNISVSVALLNWVSCYAYPSFLDTHRKVILESANGKLFTYLLSVAGWDESLTTNHIGSPSSFSPENALKSLTSLPNFGDTLKVILAQDLEIGYECFKSRLKISKGEIQQAKQNLQQLLNKIVSSGIVIRYWWESFARYWLSVTEAMLGNYIDATKGFHRLLDGPKSEAAQGQLALLALKQFQLEDAQKWLISNKDRFPATLYAHALLAWRQGEKEKAESLLESYDMKFGPGYSHYRIACMRLLASIRECTNQPKEAIALLGLVMKISPHDEVSSIRLSRLITQDAYYNYANRHLAANKAADQLSYLERLNKAVRSDCREQNCTRFLRILSDNGEKLENQNLDSMPKGYAWCQLLLRRHLDEGCTKSIIRLLKHGSPIHKIQNPPPYFTRTQFILMSWEFLKNIWQLLCNSDGNKNYKPKMNLSDFQSVYPELRQNSASLNPNPAIIQHCILATIKTGQEISQADDISVEIMTTVARYAESILLKQPLQHNDVIFANTQPLRLISAIYTICFKPDKSNKHSLSEEIIQLSQSESITLTKIQRSTALALAQWTTNDIDGFLAQIIHDPADELLPIDVEHLWLAKASAWFKKSMFKSIFEGEMPDSVADLSNQDACLLLAKASSRLALESWRKGNSREALHYIKQAASTLGSLTETN